MLILGDKVRASLSRFRCCGASRLVDVAKPVDAAVYMDGVNLVEEPAEDGGGEQLVADKDLGIIPHEPGLGSNDQAQFASRISARVEADSVTVQYIIGGCRARRDPNFELTYQSRIAR